jgi:translation initiation factor 1 (eIF-1/SUI1)
VNPFWPYIEQMNKKFLGNKIFGTNFSVNPVLTFIEQVIKIFGTNSKAGVTITIVSNPSKLQNANNHASHVLGFIAISPHNHRFLCNQSTRRQFNCWKLRACNTTSSKIRIPIILIQGDMDNSIMHLRFFSTSQSPMKAFTRGQLNYQNVCSYSTRLKTIPTTSIPRKRQSRIM